MKKYFLFFSFFILINCTNSNSVYWCGDHPCANKKEKEAYFKKTMTVEVRETNKKSVKKDSEFKKLLNQSETNEKKQALDDDELERQAKIEEELKLEQEQELERQAKIEEELKLEQEQELERQAKIEEELKLEQEQELDNGENKNSNKPNIQNQSDFERLAEIILNNDNNKSYPEINDIPK